MINSPKFNKDFQVEPGQVQTIAPFVRRIVANNPSPFTFTGTGTFLVGTGPETVVIDPGPDIADHIDILTSLLEDCPNPRYLITHTHRDHSPATAVLKQKLGGISYGFGPHTSEVAVEALEEGADREFVPDQTLKTNDCIEGTGWTLQAIHTPGHTSNHLCFYMPQNKALFSGDHVMGWSSTLIAPPDGHMGQYKTSLRQLFDLDLEVIWPSHGAPITHPKAFVQDLLDHRIAREEQILALLSTGPMWIEDIVADIYADKPSFIRPAATLSILAHLQHMVEVGTVSTKGAATKESHYRLS